MSWRGRASLGGIAVLLVVGFGYVLAYRGATGLPQRTGDGAAPLEATLVSPWPGEALEAEPSRPVEVSWDVRNVGTGAIEGLEVRADCPCNVKERLPSTLRPGETARLAVLVRPPEAGLAQRVVPIHGASRETPLLILTVPIRVRVETPSWLEAPRAVSMTGVAGEPFEQELLWRAVERPAEPAWIREVRLEPEGKAAVTLTVQEDRWGEDQRYCRRTYRILVRAKTLMPGEYGGLLWFEAGAGRPAPAQVPWRLDVLPALAVIPAKVTLGASSQGTGPAAQVTVVSRLKEPRLVRAQFDDTLLEVAPRESPPIKGRMTFEIRAKGGLKGPQETEVRFVPDGLDPNRLSVRMPPQEARQ